VIPPPLIQIFRPYPLTSGGEALGTQLGLRVVELQAKLRDKHAG